MKVSAIVIGVVVLLVVILMLTGLGGNHGPGRHSGAGRLALVSGTALRVPPDGYPIGRQIWEYSYR